MTIIRRLEEIAIELHEIATGLAVLAERNEGAPDGEIMDGYGCYIRRIGDDVGDVALELERVPDEGADPDKDATKRNVILR